VPAASISKVISALSAILVVDSTPEVAAVAEVFSFASIVTVVEKRLTADTFMSTVTSPDVEAVDSVILGTLTNLIEKGANIVIFDVPAVIAVLSSDRAMVIVSNLVLPERVGASLNFVMAL
jgi:uncharacterized membrane protein